MPLFRYSALTEDGGQARGEVEAASDRDARLQLQSEGVYVTHLSPVGGLPGLGNFREALRGRSLADLMRLEIGPTRVPTAEITAFTRQFATLVEAGIPILQALDGLLFQTTHTTMARVLRSVRERVNEGASLAEAMEEQKVFSTFYLSMVRAAEASGRLGAVMSEMAGILEERRRLTGEVRSALAYPVLVLGVGIAVVAFLLTNVVPNILSMFEDSGQQLPQATALLLSLSDALRLWGLPLAGFLVLMALLLREAVRRRSGARLAWHRFLLNLPVAGNLCRQVALARFSGTLAALLGSGVAILTALRIARDVTPFEPFKQAIEEISSGVSEGAALADGLKNHDIFPPMLVNMVQVGEQAGRLEEMLQKVAATNAGDLRQSLSGLGSLIQPVLLLLMGGVIAFIMGAVLLPIFELNTLAGGL